MLRSLSRPALTAALVASSVVVLTGCSALQSLAGGVEPERDEVTGAVTEAVEADPFALRVGDCVDTAALGVTEEVQTIMSVPTLPCDQEHDGEVYASLELEGEYPGEDGVVQAADEFCYAEFGAFVGTAYEDSALDFLTMFPTAETWELDGDRQVLCIVVDAASGVTATLAGAAY